MEGQGPPRLQQLEVRVISQTPPVVLGGVLCRGGVGLGDGTSLHGGDNVRDRHLGGNGVERDVGDDSGVYEVKLMVVELM